MPIVAAIAALAGFVAGRSIIAISDAHRRGRPDRWTTPLCDECGGPLSVLTTRCRTNRHPQRRWNVAVVGANTVLTVVMVAVVPSLWIWPAYAVFSSAMVLLTVTDLDTKLIPNRMLWPSMSLGGALLGIGWLFDTSVGSPLRALGGAAGYFAAMYLLAIIARGGLGFGDVKLAALIGLFTGFLSWEAVLIAGIGSFLIGGITSIVLLVFRIRGRKDAIPFGPFMTLAAIVAVVWWQEITAWYTG